MSAHDPLRSSAASTDSFWKVIGVPMRKRVINPLRREMTPGQPGWLDVEELAEVDITSEDPLHPIEAALLPGHTTGWRAAGPGSQTIRLRFARPQPLKQIWLHFIEPHAERTQEYVLRWSPDGGETYRDIVRQQWNFSPKGATSETEDHQVELPAVTVLELSIVPDTSGGNARASLDQLRLA